MTGSESPTGPAPRPTTVVVAFRPSAACRRGGERAPGGPIEPAVSVRRVPRVARVLALAHRWKGLIDDGTVADQAALARLVGVSRARVTQVMDLLRLAPDIQEAVLYMRRGGRGRDPVRHRDLGLVAAQPLWTVQRKAWNAVAVNPVR